MIAMVRCRSTLTDDAGSAVDFRGFLSSSVLQQSVLVCVTWVQSGGGCALFQPVSRPGVLCLLSRASTACFGFQDPKTPKHYMLL